MNLFSNFISIVKQTIKKSIIGWITFFFTVSVLYVVATVTYNLPSKVWTWSWLLSGEWNNMVDSIDYLKTNLDNTPITKIYSATRTSWVHSTTWTTIPGLEITFNLPKNWNVLLLGNWGQLSDWTCHSAYRFEIDWIATWDINHWDNIMVNRWDVAWWVTWNLSKNINLSTWNHTIKIQTRDSDWTPNCYVCYDDSLNMPWYTDCKLNIIATY